MPSIGPPRGRPARYPLAVFDFDGTLADTRKPITMSANHALEELGYAKRPDAEIQHLVGLPLAAVMGTLAGLNSAAGDAAAWDTSAGDTAAGDTAAGDERVDALCVAYRAAFVRYASGNSPMYEGAADALDTLLNAGVVLAVATSRSRRSLEMFLEAHALQDKFTVLAGGDDVHRGKPHPEMLEFVLAGAGFMRDEAIMIGDTTHDMFMGRDAGMHTCAVTYGNHDRDRLAAADPTYFADHASEIPAHVLGEDSPLSSLDG